MNKVLLLAYTKLPKDIVEYILNIYTSQQLPKRMRGRSQILGDQLLALFFHAALQQLCRLAQQCALPLAADQSALAQAEIIFRMPDQRRHQLPESITTARRNLEISVATGSPHACHMRLKCV